MSILTRNLWPALLAVTLSAGAAQAVPPHPKDKEVVVTNGVDEPVPVQLVSPNPVPVQVNGPVTIASHDTPFHFQFALDFPDGEGLAQASYTVPADKRLVIEYASLSAYLPPDGQTIFVRIITTANTGYATTDAFHTLYIQKREDYGVLKQFEGAHTVRIYANPGTQVRVSMGRLPFNNTASGNVTLSGRLEDLP